LPGVFQQSMGQLPEFSEGSQAALPQFAVTHLPYGMFIALLQ